MKSKTIKELKIGDSAQKVHKIEINDAKNYALVTGDYNPIHFDNEYAMNTKFKGTIAHGMILAGYISGVIGTDLPGAGSLYETQTMRFISPVRYGDIITTIVTVTGINEKTNRITLKTECINQNNKVVLTGEAVILPKKG